MCICLFFHNIYLFVQVQKRGPKGAVCPMGGACKLSPNEFQQFYIKLASGLHRIYTKLTSIHIWRLTAPVKSRKVQLEATGGVCQT